MPVFCFCEPILQKEVFFVSWVCFSERVSVVQNLNQQWQMRFACRQCLHLTVPTGFFLILLILNPPLAGATLGLSSPPLTVVSQSSCFNCFDYFCVDLLSGTPPLLCSTSVSLRWMAVSLIFKTSTSRLHRWLLNPCFQPLSLLEP